MDELENNAFAGLLRKIDVSGDGVNNVGPRPQSARPRAEQMGVAINGLAIKTDLRTLDDYYRKYVISGPGAFVVTAEDYHDFARAIQQKLKQELEVPVGWQFRKSSPAPQQAALR